MFTTEHQTEMHRAFDAGNYDNAYASHDLDADTLDSLNAHERVAYVLGFYSSYSLSEIPGTERDEFDAAHASPAGRWIVERAQWTEDREDEYRAEAGDYDGPDEVEPNENGPGGLYQIGGAE